LYTILLKLPRLYRHMFILAVPTNDEFAYVIAPIFKKLKSI
jgi:hypothetical protein